MPLPNNFLNLIADPTLKGKLFCRADLIKTLPHEILFIGDSTMRELYKRVLLDFENPACFDALSMIHHPFPQPNKYTEHFYFLGDNEAIK